MLSRYVLRKEKKKGHTKLFQHFTSWLKLKQWLLHLSTQENESLTKFPSKNKRLTRKKQKKNRNQSMKKRMHQTRKAKIVKRSNATTAKEITSKVIVQS